MTDDEKAFDRYVDFVLLPGVIRSYKFKDKESADGNDSEADRRVLREATEVDFTDVTDEPDEGVQTGQISGS
jgi:hypothetical protein